MWFMEEQEFKKELQIKNNEYKNDDYVDKLKKQVEKLKDDNLNHKEKIKELETELAKHKEDSKQFSDAWKKLRECIKNIEGVERRYDLCLEMCEAEKGIKEILKKRR